MKKWILIVIIALAAFLRLWNLGSVPPSLTQDEASLGYNAYSILKTGKDEYGKAFPIIFKSFGDYKPGFYVYLDVPFVATLGLNEVSTRLPSAIAGIFAVYLIFLVGRMLFDKKTATAAAFIAAVNPWLIYYSRGAWETNVVLTFTLAGIYFFLKALKDSKQLFLSALFFALTLITYQGAKLSTAIVVFILSAVYFRDLFKIDKKYITGSVFLALLVSVPIILSFIIGQSGRLKVFSIFSYPRPREYTQLFLDQGKEKIGDLNYYLFHSETLNFARGIMGRWSNYLGAKFLFIDGDYQNPQHSPPYQGMFFATDIILLLAGLYALFKKGIDKPAALVLLWMIFAPLPGVLSRDQVNAIRAMNMTAPLIFVMAFGLSRIYEFLKSKNGVFGVALRSVFMAAYLFVFVYFLDAFFIHVPMHNSPHWNYGYKEMVNYVSSIQSNYETVKVQQGYTQPYIYFLYYQKYDPAKYQKQASLTGGANTADIGFVEQLDNIKFTNVNWASDKFGKNTLLVGDPVALPENEGLLTEIKLFNGLLTAFKIIELK